MAAYDIGDKVFGKWEIVGLLGEGSYGKVWRIERHEFGVTYEAALKVISVPASEAERSAAESAGLTDKYFYSVVENFVREIALMDSLKGISSIVSYEDHEVNEHEDGVGWDILIRMELLTPLRVYMAGRELGQMEVIRLGIQLCEALEECAKRNILHRDIKPENIFVTKNGDFKLDDFGVARTLAQSRGALSQKGTASYMAPEVYRGESYGRRADIYSLGVVLYQLMNRNRLPFYPLPPEDITFSVMEKALERRLRGEALPAPFSARGQLTDIIRRAAAFLPEDRYKTPSEMKRDLLDAYNSTASMYGVPAQPAPEPEPASELEPASATGPEWEHEPASEPELEPESGPTPEQETVKEPESEPIPEPEPEPEAEQTLEPETERTERTKPDRWEKWMAVVGWSLIAAGVIVAISYWYDYCISEGHYFISAKVEFVDTSFAYAAGSVSQTYAVGMLIFRILIYGGELVLTGALLLCRSTASKLICLLGLCATSAVVMVRGYYEKVDLALPLICFALAAVLVALICMDYPVGKGVSDDGRNDR